MDKYILLNRKNIFFYYKNLYFALGMETRQG